MKTTDLSSVKNGIVNREKEEERCLHYPISSEEISRSIRTLLRVSEVYSNLIPQHPNTSTHDLADVICGWEATVQCPTRVVSSPIVVQKDRAKTIVDVDQRSFKSESCPFTEPLRRAMVELGTHRYIPGNGSYRLAKERRRIGVNHRIETNYTFMPKHSSKNSVPITEPRILPRQMHRVVDTIKDDGVMDDDTDNATSFPEESSSIGITTDHDTGVRSKSFSLKDGFHRPPQIRTGTKDFRQRKKEKMQMVSPTTANNQESGILLSKAFADTIVKNFSEKISVMGDQVRSEANWWAMTNVDAPYLETRSRKQSNSSLVDLSLPVKKKWRRRKLSQSQHTLKSKALGSQTQSNTPRYDYVESFILNPLNLEAARPRHSESDSQVVAGRIDRARRHSRDEIRDEEYDRSFQAWPVGKPNPRDRKIDLITESDVITPPMALPELFGKKLEVTISAQKLK